MPTVDDGRQGKNHTVAVINHGVYWRARYDRQVGFQVLILLMGGRINAIRQ